MIIANCCGNHQNPTDGEWPILILSLLYLSAGTLGLDICTVVDQQLQNGSVALARCFH